MTVKTILGRLKETVRVDVEEDSIGGENDEIGLSCVVDGTGVEGRRDRNEGIAV